jgi:hypothetical protein
MAAPSSASRHSSEAQLMMTDLLIPATERTPQVDFHFSQSRLSMRGESYPEDATAFFGPVYRGLSDYLADLQQANVMFELTLNYFNSSSAKALMRLFQLLEAAAKAGNQVHIRWHYAEDDETMLEFGEDFAQDFASARFELCPYSEST